MSTFYLRDIENDICHLSENDSRHAVKVLRHKNNDFISVVNGKGLLAKAKIIEANPKKTKIKVLQTKKIKVPTILGLAFCPTKSNERNSFIIEKATEIGVTDFYPLIAQNSERRKWNSIKFEKILIATLKQSGNYWLPNIHKLEAFNDFIVRKELPKLKLLAHCKQGKKQEIKNLADATKNQIVVIGPEGDFTLEEINQSIINKFQTISLGDNRLRTETACITSLAIMKFL